jgi:hypothetical protein
LKNKLSRLVNIHRQNPDAAYFGGVSGSLASWTIQSKPNDPVKTAVDEHKIFSIGIPTRVPSQPHIPRSVALAMSITVVKSPIRSFCEWSAGTVFQLPIPDAIYDRDK